MELGLKGKTALVTGASEGIGMAIARKLAEEGVRTAICARTEAKLKDTAAEITHATGMEVVPLPADLRSLAGCQGFVEQAAARLGGIDILATTPAPQPSERSSISRTTPSSMRSTASSWATFAARRPSSPTCDGAGAAPSSISPAPLSRPCPCILRAALATPPFGCSARSSPWSLAP